MDDDMTSVLATCAWILWGMLGKGVHYYPIRAFPDQAQCEQAQEIIVAEKKKAPKAQQEWTWADRYVCLPDTINPLQERKP